MALPELYGLITPIAFYPDKVTVNFQYSVHLHWRSLDNGLRANGFRLSRNEWKYELNVTGPSGYGRRGIPTRISRPRFGAPLNCYVDINALRIINQHVGDNLYEMSAIPGSDNWLPSRTITDDCRGVWAICGAYIDAAREAIAAIISDIQSQAGASHLPEPTPMHTTVHTAECAIDFYAYNPRQVVTDFMPSFAALLQDSEQSYYRAPNVVHPGANLMVHGFVTSATRLKMYCRTNRRVRFEVCFRPDTFAHFEIPRALSQGGQSFDALFGRCAEEAARLFIALRQRTRRSLNIASTHTPLDLIIALTGASRREELLREVLDVLLRTGSVRNAQYDHKFIRSLKRKEILEASLVHGHSCIAAPYGYAAALLANAQEDYFTSKLRPVPRNAFAARRTIRRTSRGSGLFRRQLCP